MPVRVEQGDCREVIPKLGVMVDAVVTDPPYEIGFMGASWDKRGVAFDPKTWRAVHSALRPGGFLVTFGGTRTYHRLVSAIEDAGFVIQDQIAWLFGSGFPKNKTLLKPAFEPICLAYKPGGKRTLQVDESRIEGTAKPFGSATESEGWRLHKRDISEWTGSALGRWPANVCHDGSEEVIEAFPESAGQQGDIRGTEPSATGDNGIYGHFNRVPFNNRGGEPSAERRYADGAGDFAMLPGSRRLDGGSLPARSGCSHARSRGRQHLRPCFAARLTGPSNPVPDHPRPWLATSGAFCS